MMSVSQSVLRVRNVEMDPRIAYLIDDSPRAPQITRSGLMTSSISSLRVSRMRPERTRTSTLGMSGFASAAATFSATDARKLFSSVGTMSSG